MVFRNQYHHPAGDIAASYSADRITEGAVRQPFHWRGSQWVCTGTAGSGATGTTYAEAVRLVPLAAFAGEPTTYSAKTRYYQDGDRETMEAREDPNGFYHSMAVKHAGNSFVLCGPPALFVPGGEADQMSLFL
jgi:hypothetical protein